MVQRSVGILIRVTLLLACAAGLSRVEAQTLDRIIAVVDKDLILESELNAQVQFFIFNNRVDPNTPGLKDQVLQSMVNEKLLIAKAIEDSVTVTDDEVQQQLDAVIAQRIQQAGSEARLEEMWGMPISRIKREFRDEMRKSLLAQKLQQQRFGTGQIGRHEVEEFYSTFKDSLPRVNEEVDLAHIFVKPRISGDARTKAMEKMQLLLDSIKAGVDFGALARRHSQDPGTAQNGGDLGLVRRGQFVKEFESAVFALSEGQVSGIVETDRGLHIIQLDERRGDAVRARHIMLKIERDKASDDAAILFLDSLRTRIAAGENFAELARKYSDDKESNLVGGNLGTLELETLDQSWATVVKETPVGEVSAPARLPVGTSYGYHIVWVKKRLTAHTMNLDQDYRKIETIAMNYKRTKDYQKWMEELRKSIYWEARLQTNANEFTK
jgi:peptidyl-prolyl cis-trans isomerase SurA